MDAPLDRRSVAAPGLGHPGSELLGGPKRESGLRESLLRHLWWGSVRLYLRIYHRFRVQGREHLPTEAPFIIVANHSSHLDVLALAACFPGRLRDRLFPIAAGDASFERVPIAGFAAVALQALPLWSKHCDPADLLELRRRLTDEPCAYVLFPEGTRTRTGEMSTFRRGIGALVASTLVPVIPCYLEGAFGALPVDKRLPRARKLLLTVGAPLRFPLTPNDQEGWTEVAAKAEAAVRALKPTTPPAG